MKRTLAIGRFAKVLLLANAAFWLIFTVYFLANSRPYKPHRFGWEEPAPVFVFFGRAYPAERYMTPFMRVTRAVQWPSYYATYKLNGWLHTLDDGLYWAISPGGYSQLLECLLSFLQWYLVGSLLDRLRHGPTTNPSRS